jgi:hypothetical protein
MFSKGMGLLSFGAFRIRFLNNLPKQEKIVL